MSSATETIGVGFSSPAEVEADVCELIARGNRSVSLAMRFTGIVLGLDLEAVEWDRYRELVARKAALGPVAYKAWLDRSHAQRSRAYRGVRVPSPTRRLI